MNIFGRSLHRLIHIPSFAGCKKSLAQGGFFTREKDYYCTECYQKNFGQRCATCGLFVEGEVVSALGNTYHQKCFTCARCRYGGMCFCQESDSKKREFYGFVYLFSCLWNVYLIKKISVKENSMFISLCRMHIFKKYHFWKTMHFLISI